VNRLIQIHVYRCLNPVYHIAGLCSWNFAVHSISQFHASAKLHAPLCLTVTEKHSGTFNAARLAAQRFGETLWVFEAFSLSLGLGVQVLEAARAAGAGRSMQEILELLEDL